MRAKISIKWLGILCLGAPSLFSMELPSKSIALSVSEVSPLQKLPTDLRAYLLSFLVVGKGATRAARLHNAAENLRNCMIINKSFAQMLTNEHVSKILVQYLSRYTARNLTQAGLALATVGARKYIQSLSNNNNRLYFPIDQEIMWAAAQGDDVSLKTLIKCNYNIIPVQARINAACGGHLSTIELLYAPGISVSHVQADKDLPLIMACRNGHTRVVQKLLEKGEDPCYVSSEWTQSTPLFVAAEWGHLDCVNLLLATNARTTINFQDRHRRTALMMAAQRGHAGVVRVLLSAGAKINMKDHVLLNALSHAVGTDCSSADYITIVQDLLAAGAEVNVPDVDFKTALFRARKNPGNIRHKKAIERLLLDHGAVE